MCISQDERCHVCIASGVSPNGICVYLPISSEVSPRAAEMMGAL
jgi:hypothetical protein